MFFVLLSIMFSYNLQAADAGDTAVGTIEGTAVGASTAMITTLTSLATTKLTFRIQCSDCGGKVPQELTTVTVGQCSAIKEQCDDETGGNTCKCTPAVAASCIATCTSIVTQNAGLAKSLIINGVVGGVTGTIGGFASALTADNGKTKGSASGTAMSALNTQANLTSSSYGGVEAAECESKKSEQERQRCYCEMNGWQYNTSTNVCSDSNTDILSTTLVAENTSASALQAASEDQANSKTSSSAELAGVGQAGSSGSDSGSTENSNDSIDGLASKNRPSLSRIAAASRANTNGSGSFSNNDLTGIDELADGNSNSLNSSNKDISTSSMDLFAMITQTMTQKYKGKIIGYKIALNRKPASAKKKNYKKRQRRK